MATALRMVFASARCGAMVPLVESKVINCGQSFANGQSMGIMTKIIGQERFLRRADGTVKRWKAGRRHLNYNQSRNKLNKSLSSQELKKPDRKVVWKLLGGKK